MKQVLIALWIAMLVQGLGEHGVALGIGVAIAYLDALLDSERRREARRKKMDL